MSGRPSRSVRPIRCRCGKLQGEVDASASSAHGVCYCRDCRAFAYYLGPPEGMLDTLGGTDVVAVQPRHVRFTQGTEHLACMSLTEKGMLRWYAACCRTPIGNTPRDMKISNVGLVHSALSANREDLAASFGPVTMYIFGENARGQAPRNARLKFFGAVVGVVGALLAARITGKYRINPFFNVESGAPRAEPIILSPEQHAELMRAV